MLESIFLMMMSMGFILFVLAVYEKSVVFSMTSILMWIMVLAGLVYIEVPGGSTHTEMGMLGVALGYIFMNIIWILVQWGYLMKTWRSP